ncbi:MAG TPA: ABC transporter substrate-binding protein [Nocardioidaceae bacterium]|nr:ABC transporter substrate-binding protein [Nocardioidaceae bacterium]
MRLATALCVAVSLAACTGDHHPVDAHPSTAALPDDSAGLDPNRTGPAPDIDGAVSGSVVTIPVPGPGFDTNDPTRTLDPSEVSYVDASGVLSSLITRSLTQYVWDEDAGGMVLIPDLATDLGTPNADYTEWTFTIRSGVRFEDGTPVTADDVAYGIKRSMDKKRLPGAPKWGHEFFLDGHTYKGLYTSGSTYDAIVVDGNRLTIKMSKPFPDMPYYGTFPEMGPIPETNSDPATYYLHPLATGPYKVKEFDPGESLTLVRNEWWDPNTDPGRHQYVDGFDFQFRVKDSATLDAMIADRGRARTSVTLDGLSSELLLPGHTVADRVIAGRTQCTIFMVPDPDKVDEVLVRRALGYAWPYQRLWRAIGLIDGLTAYPAATIMPPGTPGRVDYEPLATQPGRTDPAAALRLLEEAGHERGEYQIGFAYLRSQPTGTIIANALRRAGFDPAPQPEPTLHALDAIQHDPNSPLAVTPGGGCADWPSASYWVLADLGGLDPDIDREIERVRALPLDEQASAWGALDQTIETDYYPVIPTVNLGVAQVRGSRIGGLHFDSVLASPTLKDVYVLPAQED